MPSSSVSDPDISPDGAQIAFVVSRPDYAANDTATELAVVDIASGAQRSLVQGRRDHRVAALVA